MLLLLSAVSSIPCFHDVSWEEHWTVLVRSTKHDAPLVL